MGLCELFRKKGPDAQVVKTLHDFFHFRPYRRGIATPPCPPPEPDEMDQVQDDLFILGIIIGSENDGLS